MCVCQPIIILSNEMIQWRILLLTDIIISNIIIIVCVK